MFQNSYQETPLDFYTEYFYLNRKAAIQLRLKEMCNWNIEAATNFLTSVYTKNFNTLCIVKWKEHFTSEMFCVNILA